MSELVNSIEVEVAYAEPQRQILVSFTLTDPATVEDALLAAKEDVRFNGVDLLALQCGVFGRAISLDQRGRHQLRAGDRVEVYRPLEVDAKTARLRRAAEQRRSQN